MVNAHPGALRRLADRLARSGDPMEAAAHPEQVEADEVAVGALRMRSRATVIGEVRSVTLRPRDDVPALVVELWDGSDALQLVWLGRRSIPGIEPGITLRATGRVTTHRRMSTIFNPAYEIVVAGRHHG